jgi:hypothetical protein
MRLKQAIGGAFREYLERPSGVPDRPGMTHKLDLLQPEVIC